MPYDLWLSRLSEEFGCLPSAAIREWQRAPDGLLERIIEARHYARHGQTAEARRAQPLLRVDGLTYRPLSRRHKRIAAALTTRPYASTDERKKVTRRLERLGVTWVCLPTGGWTSVGHLKNAGWVP